MFIPLKNLLEKNLKKSGISRQVEAALVLEKFEKVVGELISQEMTKRVKALVLKDKILGVAVLSSVAAAELKLREKQLLKIINQHFKKRVVDKLRFMI